MALRVVRVRVVQVVRGDERQVERFREPEEVAADARLDAEPVVHELAEEVVLAEDVAEVGRRLQRLVVLSEPEPRLHLARRQPVVAMSPVL